MNAPRLPAEIEALSSGPIDAEALAGLRAFFLGEEKLSAERADQLFLLADFVGDRATPEFQALLQEALSQFFLQDFDPFRLGATQV